MAPPKVGRYAVEVADGKPAISGGSVEVGPTIRNVAAVKEFPSIDGVSTLYELFTKSAKTYGQRKCLGWKPTPKSQGYEYLTYSQVADNAKAMANALWHHAELRPQGRVGVYGGNCVEWTITQQAVNRLAGRIVQYIMQHASVSVVVVAGDKFKQLLAVLPAIKSQVSLVVYWGTVDSAMLLDANKTGVPIKAFDALVTDGSAQEPVQPIPPSPEDPACIMYTSGTTGNPKGVIITHANVVATVSGLHVFLASINEGVTETDCYLSFLTKAHIFGMVAEEFVLSVGGHIAYWQNDVKLLLHDARAARPTLFAAVPRVLERVVTETKATLATKSGLIQRIFNWAVDKKIKRMYRTGQVKQAATCLEPLLFKAVKGAFGGRVRFIVSGGAPLTTYVQEFLQATMSTPIIQGYGLTETCAASFLATGHPDFLATVGPPMAHTEFRLAATPELGYKPSSTPSRGEVCIRGPGVFAGYLDAEGLTKEAFDADGFFLTGDVGEITPHGGLRIIDRKKNMFKLAQGEYVAAEHLETVFAKADVVEQIWVYGNSYESCLVAVVVPNARVLQVWAKDQGGSYAQLLTSDKARSFVLSELTATGKASKLRGFELIKAVHLEEYEWELGGELMTPSFKLKRAPLLKRYQQEVDGMYASLRAQQAAKK